MEMVTAEKGLSCQDDLELIQWKYTQQGEESLNAGLLPPCTGLWKPLIETGSHCLAYTCPVLSLRDTFSLDVSESPKGLHVLLISKKYVNLRSGFRG